MNVILLLCASALKERHTRLKTSCKGKLSNFGFTVPASSSEISNNELSNRPVETDTASMFDKIISDSSSLIFSLRAPINSCIACSG